MPKSPRKMIIYQPAFFPCTSLSFSYPSYRREVLKIIFENILISEYLGS